MQVDDGRRDATPNRGQDLHRRVQRADLPDELGHSAGHPSGADHCHWAVKTGMGGMG